MVWCLVKNKDNFTFTSLAREQEGCQYHSPPMEMILRQLQSTPILSTSFLMIPVNAIFQTPGSSDW
jgi:hypothetical protein